MASNRVLVVEDDPSVRGLLQTILEDEALEVILAADGEEGLKLARTVDPDVVLLDVMMPGLGGPDIIRRLRQPDGSLPFAVLVVTGAPDVIAPLRSELGPEAVLEKPFDITTLATRVKSLASGDKRILLVGIQDLQVRFTPIKAGGAAAHAQKNMPTVSQRRRLSAGP